jgi:hypothetical protein
MQIGKYKTAKTYGAYFVELNKDYGAKLCEAIIDSYKSYPRRYLISKTLLGYDNEKRLVNVLLTQPALSTKITALYNHVVRGSVLADPGQNIGDQILRRIFITYWYKTHSNPLGKLMKDLSI